MEMVPESHRSLLRADVAVLATQGHDGYPQVSALWFLLDDDGALKLSLNTSRQKVKNLRAHSECTLFILDPSTPYRTVEIRAQAELVADPDYAFAEKLARKYGDVDFKSIDQPGESRVVVILHPVKVNIWG